MSQILDLVKSLTGDEIHFFPFLIVVLVFIVVVEVSLTVRYLYWARKAKSRIVFGPVKIARSVTGGLTKKTANDIKTELDSTIETLYRLREHYKSWETRIELGGEFNTMMALIASYLKLKLESEIYIPSSKEITEDFDKVTLKTKLFDATLGTLIRTLRELRRMLPAYGKRKFMGNIVNIEFTQDDNQVKVNVWRRNRNSLREVEKEQDTTLPPENLVYKVPPGVETSKIIRATSFMVLEIYDLGLFRLNWHGMKHFVDGLVHLADYCSSIKPDMADLNLAKQEFKTTTEKDPNATEACCLLGAMQLAERTNESIRIAIKCFKQALNKEQDDGPFQTFGHTGLAHCYLQEYHRCGKRKPGVLRKANDHIQLATQFSDAKEPQPWIKYTQAIAKVVDEARGLSADDAREQLVPGANLCAEALELEPDNPIFINGLGWILLKLAEKGVLELTAADGAHPQLVGNVAKLSEHFFTLSIELDPGNKLAYANLCLLFATSPFRKKTEYIRKCLFNGKKAVSIDPHYINGYRDLALSLLWHGELKEARKYYMKALEEARNITKDQEIMNDAQAVLNEIGADEATRKDWSNPPSHLLEPVSDSQDVTV